MAALNLGLPFLFATLPRRRGGAETRREDRVIARDPPRILSPSASSPKNYLRQSRRDRVHCEMVTGDTDIICEPKTQSRQGRMIVARPRFRGRACALRNKCRVKENSNPSALPKARAQRSGAHKFA